MSKNNQPSVDPANNDTLAGVFQFALIKWLQRTNDMLPAKVIAFKPASATSPALVQVQPMVNTVGTSGLQTQQAQFPEIPVLSMGGGGFIMYFNLKPGDLGWIKANDRDISLFMQSLQVSPPNTNRMHSFSDGIFIPGVLMQYLINPEDAGNMVLQSLDGTVKISLGNTKIKIAAPTVEIDGQAAIIANSPIQVTMTTPLLLVNGNIAATGTITPGV